MTICKRCNNHFIKRYNAEKYCNECKLLAAYENKTKSNMSYKKEHKSEIDNKNKEYREINRQKIRDRDLIYYHENREKRIADGKRNPNRKINRRNSQTSRRKDPVFRIRQNISLSINKAIKRNGGTKNGSILKYLPYTIQELKQHLEKQFESWMNWNNWGVYNQDTWDDNNQSTWTWNIDHIIPKSTFNYISMCEESFFKCWSLDNLRPYSAKQNIIDQNRMRNI